MSDARGSSAAEIEKLAHQLGVPASRLDFLSKLPAADLRALRQQVGSYLFEADKHHFTKIAAVARLVPTAVAAKLTEFALPPLVAARTAEVLDPAKAADMVTRLSEGYLADVSAAMDPGRAPDLIERIPSEQVAKVTAELARRGEWVVMGGFVSVISESALRSAVAGLDGEQLVRIGFVLDDLSRMDEITAMLSESQLDAMLTATVEKRLWEEFDGVVSNLTGAQARRLAERYAAAPPRVRSAIASAALSPQARAALDA